MVLSVEPALRNMIAFDNNSGCGRKSGNAFTGHRPKAIEWSDVGRLPRDLLDFPQTKFVCSGSPQVCELLSQDFQSPWGRSPVTGESRKRHSAGQESRHSQNPTRSGAQLAERVLERTKATKANRAPAGREASQEKGQCQSSFPKGHWLALQ